MADMNIVGGAWKLTATATQAGTQTVVLSTENKFVDKNVVLEFNTPSAGVPTLTITDKTNAVTVGDASAGVFPLTNSLSGVTSYDNAGWVGTSGAGAATDAEVQVGTIAQSTMTVGGTTISSGSVVSPDAVNNTTVTIGAGYEAQRTLVIAPTSAGTSASATVAISKQATAPTLSNTESAQNGKIQIPVIPTDDSDDIVTYFLALTANAPQTTLDATAVNKTVNLAGYLSTATQVTVSGNVSANSSLYYIPLSSADVSLYVNQDDATPVAGNSTAAVVDKTRLNISPTLYTNTINTYYIPIDISAPATTVDAANITTTVNYNGYLTSASQVSAVIGTNATTATYYIPLDTASLNPGAGAVGASGTAGNVVISTSDTATSAYYIEINGSGSSVIGSAGWIAAGTTQASNTATQYISLNSASATESVSTGIVSISEGYVPSTGITLNLTAGNITTSSTANASYITNTTAIVPTGGYLLIGEGYYPNTQIALSTIIPDDANYDNAQVDKILQGYEAYDSDGTKLIGTLATYTGTYTIS